jgi:hypothetical protein
MCRRVRLFGDDDYAFLIEENASGAAVSTRVLRLADGSTVTAPDFTKPFARRVQTFGRTLVFTEKSDKGTLLLRLYDIPTGVVVWEGTFADKSLVLRSEAPRLAGVIEPDGKVHIVDVQTCKKVLASEVRDPKESLRKVDTIYLLADPQHFYLACWGRDKASHGKDWADEPSKEKSPLGRRGVPVNGMLCAFARLRQAILEHRCAKSALGTRCL